jgi:predicted PurR-regulated permease PerM
MDVPSVYVSDRIARDGNYARGNGELWQDCYEARVSAPKEMRSNEQPLKKTTSVMANETAGQIRLGTNGVVEKLANLLGNRFYKAVLLVFVLAIIFRYFDAISHMLLLAFVGAIIGIALNGLVKRIPLKWGYSVAIVAVTTLLVLAGSVYLIIQAVAAQLRAFIDDLPAIIESVDAWVQNLGEELGIDLELMGPQMQDVLGNVLGAGTGAAVLGGAMGLLEVVAIFVLVLMGAFFVVAKPNDQLLNPLLRTVPRDRRPAYYRMLNRLGTRLSQWLFGTLISMVAVGIGTAVVFVLLGVPYSILLGLLTGLLSIIPLIGPWIGGIIAVIVTLFFDPGLVVWVALAIIIIQELEGNLLRPLVMSGSAKLHPFVTLLSLLLFGSMFGILGAILSLPLTIAIGTFVEVLWVEETLGTQDDEIKPVVQDAEE